MSQNQENQTGSVCRQWIFSLVSSAMVFTYGLQIGWMSPAIPVLKSENSPSGYPLSSLEISWIASMLCIMACFSSTAYSYVADRFGRQVGLIAVAVPQALGFITTLISAHPAALLISRGFCGIGSGGVFIIGPLYIKEISEDSLRGILGTVNMLVQSIALLIMYAIGAYLDYYTVIWIVVWVPILNIVAMIKAPESPGYLVKKGRIEEAISVMAYLKGVDEDNKKLQIDLQRIKNEVAQFENLPQISLKTIISDKASRRATLLAVLLLTSLDISGNYAIFTYASVIILESGVTIQPELQSLSFPTVMILGSLLSVVAIERIGRKPLFLASLLMTGVPMAILASVLVFQTNGGTVHWSIPILCIISCVFSYGIALPVPYVVMSEIFNVQLRARILGYILTYAWFLCFLQIVAFAPISVYLGMYTMFYIFSAINLISAVIIYILVPETKGKSLEEIEKKLCGEKE